MLGKRHIMVDLETLGIDEGSTVFQIALASFDIKSGEVFDKIDYIIDISKDDNLNVDGGTLKWWLNTDKELLTNLLNKGELGKLEALHGVYAWIKEQGKPRDVTLWGNGIIFDNVKLKEQFEAVGISYPIHYKNDRDVRTILALASSLGVTEEEIRVSIEDNDKKHDAMSDVLYQIRLVSKCYEIIEGGRV